VAFKKYYITGISALLQREIYSGEADGNDVAGASYIPPLAQTSSCMRTLCCTAEEVSGEGSYADLAISASGKTCLESCNLPTASLIPGMCKHLFQG
jgi:hypothetical protein